MLTEKSCPVDAQCVNLAKAKEMSFWAEYFGVTEEKLKEIMVKVGTSTQAIEEYVNHLVLYYSSVMIS